MFRKLISQKGSYTITLPKNWVDKNNLSDKDSINIDEDEFSGDLKISKTNKSSNNSIEITINTKKSDDKNIIRSVNQSYKLGYDKIILKEFDPKKDVEIKEVVDKNYIGFNVYRKGNSIIIESMLEETIDRNQVKNLIRKIFFLIKETCEAKEEDLDFLTTNTDKYINYLRRIIMKYEFENKQSYTYNTNLARLNMIQHTITTIKKDIKNDKESEKVFRELINYFNLFESAFNKLKLEEFIKVDNKKAEIDAKINSLLDKKRPYIKYMYELSRNIQLANNSSRALLIESQLTKD